MPEQSYKRSSATYSFLYKNGIVSSRELAKRWPTLGDRAQIFFNALVRLLVPSHPNEPHNFIPHYASCHQQPPLEIRLGRQTFPFHWVSPASIHSALRAGEARNLGALLFLNVLSNNVFSNKTLHLARSQNTKAFYFTQLLSPDSVPFLNSSEDPLSFEKETFHEKLHATLASFLTSSAPAWWTATGLLGKKEGSIFINYKNILVDEILVTMLRLYLTPASVIESLMESSFKGYPQDDNTNHLKATIRETLERFQTTFQQSIFPSLASEKIVQNFFTLYNNYISDILRFSVYPFDEIQSACDKRTCDLMEFEILNKAMAILCPPPLFFESELGKYLDLSVDYFQEMISSRSHFLWTALNSIAANLLDDPTRNYQFTPSTHLQCLLVKSIEYHHDSFSKFFLSHLISEPMRIEMIDSELGERVCERIRRPAWSFYGLLDVANTTQNKEITKCLQKMGARSLLPPVKITNNYVPLPYLSNLFFTPAEEKQRYLMRRERANAYGDLSELLQQMPKSPPSKNQLT